MVLEIDPLAPLNESEVELSVEILRNQGKINEFFRFITVSLK